MTASLKRQAAVRRSVEEEFWAALRATCSRPSGQANLRCLGASRFDQAQKFILTGEVK